MRLFLLILLTLSIFSCNKNTVIPPLEPIPLVEEGLEVVWQTPLVTDFTLTNSINPILWNKNIIFSTKDNGPIEELKIHNKLTGELYWLWSNPNCHRIGAIKGDKVYNDKIAIPSVSKIYVLDLGNKSEKWVSNSFNNLSNALTLLEGRVYATDKGDGLNYEWRKLVGSDINSPDWEDIIVQHRDGDFRPGLMQPTKVVNSDGDEIFYYHTRDFNYPHPTKSRSDVIAYNLTTQEEIWHTDSVAPTGNASNHPLVIVHDKIYFQGQGSISCLDATNGALLWQRYFPNLTEDFLTCNIVYAEDKIIAKSTNDNLYAFNPETGSTIWKTSGTSENCTNMVYYDGKVFYAGLGSHVIQAVDISNGKIVWTEASPNKKNGYPSAAFAGGIAIDQETGYLYTNDRYFAMCIKIPDDL